MGTDRLTLIAITLLVTTALVAGAGVTAAQEGPEATTDDPNADAGNESDTIETGPYEIEELREGGRVVPGGDPSMRWLSSSGSIHVDYASADPLSPTAEEWEVENVLAPGSVVEVDELNVNANRARNAGSEEYQLVVVSYQTDTVERISDREGETVAETAAVDQSVREYDLRFEGARARETIDLENTDGETRQVTMWLEDATGQPVDGARWRFEHQSTPTSTDPGIATTGDLYGWVGLFVLLPGFVGIPTSVWTASKIHAKTGTGPMIPGVLYAAGAILAMFMIALFAWLEFATLITALPLILGVSMVVVAFVAYLEYGSGDVIRVLFVRDELGEAVSPNGEEVSDVLYEDLRSEKLVRLDEDGVYVLVKSGIRPFLARLFGVAPTIDVSELETQITAEGDKWDKIFVADPTAETAIDYKQPTLRFPFTTGDDSDDDQDDESDDSSRVPSSLESIQWNVVVATIVGMGFGALAGGMIQLQTFGMFVGGATAFALAAGTVDDGYARFEPAPVHYLSARPQVLKSASELSDARTIDDLEEIALSATTDTALEARRVSSRMDKTVSERMTERELGLGDVTDETNPDVDEPDVDQDDRDDRVDDPDEREPTELVVRDE